MKRTPQVPCTCLSGRPFSRCCGPYLAGEATAPTAAALMRSRYSAFCRSNIDYLIATRHASTRSADDRRSLANSVNQTQWVNLQVLATQKGQQKDKTGTVEFVAAYRLRQLSISGLAAAEPQPVVRQLHEKSRFVREGRQWFYTDGDILPLYEPKRGQPCWCGSGEKFKQCHG